MEKTQTELTQGIILHGHFQHRPEAETSLYRRYTHFDLGGLSELQGVQRENLRTVLEGNG
jgi:hypothetical protein